MLVTTVGNFVLAQHLYRKGQGHKGLLWAAIGFNVFVLAFFRSTQFFIPELTTLLMNLGLTTELGVAQILLPVGLSFYIVENISYQVDVYRGQVSATFDLVDYALYQAYFPKLLAGPIERAVTFLPKLEQPRMVDNSVIAHSFTLIVVGLLRKLIIADSLTASIPEEVFTTPTLLSAYELWGWLIVYGFALYNDFAGYTSLVRGVSSLFGIELSPNFQQPYFARNFGEFWNSWHVTLSQWLRDYIYSPLLRALLRRNRSRRSVPNIVIPPLITMLMSGLWHGFTIQMLVWGGLHGIYQIGERILSLRGPVLPPDRQSWWRQLLAMGAIFILVMWAWVPFRVEMPIAVQFWQQLLSLGTFHLQYRRLGLTLGYLFVSLALDVIQRRYQNEVVFLRWPRPVQAAALAAVIFLILIVSSGTVSEPFVYQGF
jgi:D-alanyl-lipoteichoic acid acyltransferase DltB (MBOAT superfamily)